FAEPRTIIVAASAVVLVGLRLLAQMRARKVAGAISKALSGARRLHDAAHQRADVQYRQELEHFQTEFVRITSTADEQVKRAQTNASQERVSCRMKYDERTVAVTARHEQHTRAWAARVEKQYGDAL